MEGRMAEESSDRRPPVDGGAPRQTGGAMATLVVAAIVVAGLYFARPILEPLALALLLSLLLAPAVRWLHLHGLGRVPAVLATVVVAFVVIVGFAAVVGEEAINLTQQLPQYQENIAAKIRSLNEGVPGAGMLGRATRVFQDLGREITGSPGIVGPAPTPVEIVNTEPPSLQIVRNIVGP